jgi:hypothetical protein
MAKVKIVKNERDPPLITGKLLIKFQFYQQLTGEERRVAFIFGRNNQ